MQERVLALEHRMEGIEIRLGQVEDKLAWVEDKLCHLLDAVAVIRLELGTKPTTAALSYMIPTALWALLAIAALAYFVAGFVGRAAVL